MRRDFEPLATRSARHVIVDPDQVVFALDEQGAVAVAGSGRNLSLLGPPHPPDGLVVGPAAARTLVPGRPLLRFLREELTLVHVSERTTLN